MAPCIAAGRPSETTVTSSNSWHLTSCAPECSTLSMAQWGQATFESPRPLTISDVELYVHQCESCIAQKGPTQRSHAPLQQYQMGAPIEPMGVDILGPFPMTDQESRYVLVAMDYFTKWPEAYAAPDQSATTTAEHLVKEMFCHFSVPEE
ncbi:hypothetical protein ABVT39_011241 [Epinephelus coioides]